MSPALATKAFWNMLLCIVIAAASPHAAAGASKQAYYYLVFSNPVPGKEDAYLKWYEGQHIHDLLGVDGVVGAQFFKISEVQYRDHPPQRFLMIWEIETDHLAGVLADVHSRQLDGRTVMNDAFDHSSVDSRVFQPITGRVSRDEIVKKTPEEIRTTGNARADDGSAISSPPARRDRNYFIVFSNPVPGKEDAYLKWYEGQHIHDLLGIDGFSAAQFFKLSDAQQPNADQKQRFMMMWEIKTGNTTAAFAELRTKLADGTALPSAAFDRTTNISETFTPVTRRVRKNEVQNRSAREVYDIAVKGIP